MSTRLSKVDKLNVSAHLQRLLNNVVCFVGFPVTDRAKVIELWNSKFPEDLVQAITMFGRYGLGMSAGVGAENIRWGTDIDGVLHMGTIKIDEIGPVSPDNLRSGVCQYPVDFIQSIRKTHARMLYDTANPDGLYALELTREDMEKVWGHDLTDEVISWMQQCAKMREELLIASKTISEIFEMAETAGQIKRMVPDLLQYMPERQRRAFEEQKRASTMPFDWAPYDKRRIDVMLMQINKGHLLNNMAKPNRSGLSVGMIDCHTWARTGVRWG